MVKYPSRIFVAVAVVAASLAAGGAVLAVGGGESASSPRRVAPAVEAPEVTVPPTSVTVPPTAPRGTTRILALGDSNLAFADGPVHAALGAAGIEGELRGVPSFGLKDFESFWLPLVPGLVQAQDPDVVVVALGTNDVWDADDVESFPARIDQMMEAIGDRRVVWVTHFDDRGGVSYPAQRVNDAIRAAPFRWASLAVLDLAPLINANTALLEPDRLHFSPSGQQFYGQEIAVAVNQAAAVAPGQPVSLPPATLPASPLG